MWIVCVNGRACCCLLRGKLYTVGRGECDIILTGDASISRQHLTLQIEEEEEREEKKKKEHTRGVARPCVIITDTSTHGTEVYPASSTSNTHNNSDTSRSNSPTSAIGSDHSSSSSTMSDGSNSESMEAPATRTLQLCRRPAPSCLLTRGDSFRIPRTNLAWRRCTIHVGTSHREALTSNPPPESHERVTLELRWAPLRVFALGVVKAQDAQLQSNMRRCCADVVGDFMQANCLVTSHFTPTPVAIAMLCRTAHIVTPAYFEALVNINTSCSSSADNDSKEETGEVRHSKKKDSGAGGILLDLEAYAPSLDPFWATLWKEGRHHNTHQHVQGEQHIQRQLLYPVNRNDRRTLFAGHVFVVLQRSLYAEVCNFLPCTQAQVLLDTSLHDVVGETQRDTSLQAFAARHNGHIVLYSSRERLPFRHCVRALRETVRLRCVEYHHLVKSIVCIAPLVLEPPLENPRTTTTTTTTAAATAAATMEEAEEGKEPLLTEEEEEKEEGQQQESIKCGELCGLKAARTAVGVKRVRTAHSPSGRRTDPNPLFRETHGTTRMEHPHQHYRHQCKDDDECDRRLSNGEEEKVGGWIIREDKDVDNTVDATTTTTTTTTTVDLVVSGPPTLPSYPCFQLYSTVSSSSSLNATATTIASNTTVLGVKCFRKQHLTLCDETVEMDTAAGTTENGNTVLATTRAIDADDIIPATAAAAEATRLSTSRFNVFDAAAQHHQGQQQRQNRTATARRRGTTRTTTTGRTGGMGREEEKVDVIPLHVGSLKKTGGGPVNIFDIEALF